MYQITIEVICIKAFFSFLNEPILVLEVSDSPNCNYDVTIVGSKDNLLELLECKWMKMKNSLMSFLLLILTFKLFYFSNKYFPVNQIFIIFCISN